MTGFHDSLEIIRPVLRAIGSNRVQDVKRTLEAAEDMRCVCVCVMLHTLFQDALCVWLSPCHSGWHCGHPTDTETPHTHGSKFTHLHSHTHTRTCAVVSLFD